MVVGSDCRRPWEPTGPSRSFSNLIFRPFLVEFPAVRIEWESIRASFLTCEAGERDVAERGHGHPCGQQPMDETYGHCAQGTTASRLRRWNYQRPGDDCRCEQRKSPHSVSFSILFSRLFFFVLQLLPSYLTLLIFGQVFTKPIVL